MSVIDQLESGSESRSGRPSKRGLGKFAVAIIGLAAARLASDQEGAVAYDCQRSPCCALAKCNVCSYSGNKCNYTCPAGYYKRAWYCVPTGGNRAFGCGECAAGASCWDGPFACSIWWDDATC